MNIESDETPQNDLVGNERVYELRKRNFTKHFVNTVSLIGYVFIVIQYIKFGTSFWILLIRSSSQSLLTNPFPNNAHLRRIANRTNRNSTPATNTSMPGGFISSIESTDNDIDENNMVPTVSESIAVNEIIEVKKKIRKLLFHSALTFNLVVFIWNIFHPTHFMNKLEGDHLNEKNLTNAPSPFVTGNRILGGELRGGVFLQIIGEALPQSDLWGNIGKLGYDFLIIVLQYTLFILTCINFGELGYEEAPDTKFLKSDGYDGKVLVAEINYNQPIKDLTEEQNDNENDSTYI